MTSSEASGLASEIAPDLVLEATLAAAIDESLRDHRVDNALFLSERLVALRDAEANALLHARCLYASGKAHACTEVLGSRLTTPSARYLYARACYDLGRLAEAERALRGDVGSGGEYVGRYGSRRRPNVAEDDAIACAGATGEYLLGLICKDTGRRESAIARFTRALMADPLMWVAYEGLCALGADAEAKACASSGREDSILAMYPSLTGSSGLLACAAHGTRGEASGGSAPTSPLRPRMTSEDHEAATSTPATAPMKEMRDVGVPPSTGASDRTRTGEVWDASNLLTPAVGGFGDIGKAGDSVGAAFVTPSPSSVAAAPPPPQKLAGGRAPPTTGAPRTGQPSTALPPTMGEDGGATVTAARGLFGERRKFMDEGKLRKVSGRLFSDDPASTAVRRSTRIQAARSQNAAMSPPRGDDESYLFQVPEDGEVSYDTSRSFGDIHDQGIWSWQPAASVRTGEGVLLALNMLRPIAEGLRHLTMYRCDEAIQSFQQLSKSQYNTPYVLCAVAKAHAEMVDYSNSLKVFEEARAVAPYRLDSIDVYSTVLWHLKEEVKLAHLAQEVQAIDRLAPQTWCVLGNCFSLQNEHETALKFFQRAIQLDPKCTYAHTLSGHEYFANEDFEKSMNCYRAALRLDPRHYNAWYGLGTVYYRQEKYVMSEYHFRYALGINPKSSVLYCYAGMAKHALNETDEALALLSQAIALDAKNPLARYEMAAVLMSDENYEAALDELHKLKDIAPKEASVFFLMGRIYKKLGIQEEAMINFSVALDLHPANTDVNSIKNAIEKLDSDDLSDEENI